MKRIVLSFGFIISMSSYLMASNYVNSYVKRDGTYVQGHYRSSPNSSRYDNYSTKGNYNPYTGKQGTKSPYNYNSSSYGANTRKHSW